MSTGTLLFGRSGQSACQWALNSGHSEPIPLIQNSRIWGNVVISPDGQWMAYVEGETSPQTITITAPNGKLIASLPWDEKWGSLDSWFTNDWLRLLPLDAPPFSMTLVSPWTGEVKFLNPNLPDPDPNGEGNYGRVTFSPDLTRVVYMMLDRVSLQSRFVLWDLEKNQTLWYSNYDIRSTHAMFSFPVWSPDGEKFLITDQHPNDREGQAFLQDLFVISRDGQIIRSTYLRDDFPSHQIGLQSKWSPDSKTIAFWVLGSNTVDRRPYQLFVFRPDTGNVADLCIENNDSPAMVWSPDSQQIAAVMGEPNKTHLAIIDLENAKALEVLPQENVALVGWANIP